MFSLEKKVVVITGAGGLLGHQHSLAAASAGADLFLLDVDLNALKLLRMIFKKNLIALLKSLEQI